MPISNNKSRLRSRSVVLAIVIVIIFIFSVIFYFQFLSPPQSSPTQPLYSMIDAYNLHDANGVLDCTVFKYSSPTDRAQALSSIQSELDSISYVYKIDYTNIIDKETMEPSLTGDIELNIADLEAEFGIDIIDYCVIQCGITITKQDGNSETQSLNVLSLNIDSSWYIFIPDLIPPSGPTISLVKSETTASYVLTVLSINGANQISSSDMYIEVRKADGSIGLSMRAVSSLVPGTEYYGIQFIDSTIIGYLNSGDSFSFDKTIYKQESKVTFANNPDLEGFSIGYIL